MLKNPVSKGLNDPVHEETRVTPNTIKITKKEGSFAGVKIFGHVKIHIYIYIYIIYISTASIYFYN